MQAAPSTERKIQFVTQEDAEKGPFTLTFFRAFIIISEEGKPSD
jgi:hypothetical protein